MTHLGAGISQDTFNYFDGGKIDFVNVDAGQGHRRAVFGRFSLNSTHATSVFAMGLEFLQLG
jgi:hypothetical protein